MMPDSLPEELIATILEQAYYTSGAFKPDVDTLKACALVSTSWSPQAQRLLFRSAHLQSHRGDHGGLKSFLRAIDPYSERGKFLGSCVRAVDLQVSERTVGGCSVPDFLFIVESCPRLYDINLSTDVHRFDDATMDTLRKISNDKTRGTVRALGLRCGVQSPTLYQLLDVWPTIRFLRLGAELAALPPHQPATVQLYELVLFRLPTHGPLTWLLSNSTQSLEIVDFREIPSKLMDPLLESIGPRLRSLRLMRYNVRAAAVIKSFSNLEELVLYQLSSFLGLDNLPNTLQHLSFRNFPWSTCPSLQSVIRAVDTLPRLRVVSCDPDTLEHPDFPLLRRKCQGKGIDLRTDAPPIYSVSMVMLQRVQ